MANGVLGRSEFAPQVPAGNWVYRAGAALAFLTVALIVMLGHGPI